jgi:hypothetical protein
MHKNKCTHPINVHINLTTEILPFGSTAFIFWNVEFAQGIYQHDNTMIVERWVRGGGGGRLECIDLV